MSTTIVGFHQIEAPSETVCLLNAQKMAEVVLLNVFRMGFPASLLSDKICLYGQLEPPCRTIGDDIKADLPEGVEDGKHHRLGGEAELEVPQVSRLLQPLEGSGWNTEVAVTAGAPSILQAVFLLLALGVLEAGVPHTALPAHAAHRNFEVRMGEVSNPEASLEH